MDEVRSGSGRRRLLLIAGGGILALAGAAAFWLGRAETPVMALASPTFVEQAAAAGIDHVYDGEFTFFVGGGVAVFDCDADLKPDLYLAGGANNAGLYRNMSEVGGSLEFEVVAGQGDLAGVTGAYPLDADSDGVVDLAVLRFGENVMLRGLGDCRFERANEIWSIDGGDVWTAAFSAQWEGSSQWPTLAFGNYVALDENGQQFGGCADNVVLRPNDDTYGTPLVLAPSLCTLSVLFSDWSRSGQRDLRISNDRQYYRDGEEQLWLFEPDVAPRLYARTDGWQKVQIWGMGIASQDITGDGLPEVFLTSQGDNKLQTLADDGTEPNYTDIAIRRGATLHRPFVGDATFPSTAWHAEFDDVNNDGFVDLYVSKGNVEAMPNFAADDPNNLLLGQPDGSFVEGAEAAGIMNTARTRGAALVDFNLDGLLDVVEVNRREPVTLWRNVGAGSAEAAESMGNWLALRLEQAAGNRNAIGAWIEVQVGDLVMHRELVVGGGHAGGQLGWVHFGIGPARDVTVRVQWPDGTVDPWRSLPANRFAIIERGIDEPSLWSPTE